MNRQQSDTEVHHQNPPLEESQLLKTFSIWCNSLVRKIICNHQFYRFSAVLDEKIEQRQQKVESEREKEIMELNER